ncbi:MAG TPA: hypothetical protein VJO99_24255 [Burkholderiaceae bacterium]|nr:hypothetical protein [Burkholderiaceae bacterium]
MSGSNSSVPGSGASLDGSAPLSFTVHSMPAPVLADDAVRRTASGRMKMFLVLLVCAAPVLASYVTYFVIRPEGRTNYSELIQPLRPMPAALPLADLQGVQVMPEALKGQWLLVVVASGACDARCERLLWLQRQLRETLGRDKDRVDKLWLVDDAAVPRAETLAAVGDETNGMHVLRAPRAALAEWLAPAPQHTLEQHLYVVDPLGNWMMRVPADPEPAKLKRDVDKLLRASAGWDKPGR